MHRLIHCFLLVVLLTSCGRQDIYSQGMRPDAFDSKALLADIRIERWGEHRFSGLLAMREKEGEYFFTLLDATGVTLLRGELSASADEVERELKGPMRQSGVGDYLATAFTRIFLLEPIRVPCSRELLSSFCLGADQATKNGTIKYEKFGPFTRWRVTRRSSGVLEYSQPWLGVRIRVRKISGGN